MARKELIFGVLLALSAPQALFAQDPSSLSAEQRDVLGRLFTEARNAFEANDYPTSIARLEEAYALLPEPNILYRIAEMHEELGERDRAIARYEAYLVARPDAPNAAVVKTRVQRLRAEQDAATPKTGRLTIDSVPQGARVYLNQNERQGTTPLELEVEPGDHVIRLEYEGYEPSERAIGVEAGDLRTFDFRLTAVAKPVVPVDEASAAPWVLFSVGAASAITSGVFFVIASDRQDTLDAYDAARRSGARPADYDSVLDQEKTYRVAAWSTAGVAVGALAVGGLWWWLDDSGERQVSVGPTGVRVVTSF